MSGQITVADIEAVVSKLKEHKVPDPVIIAPSLEAAREMTGLDLEQRGRALFQGEKFVGQVVPELYELGAPT